MKRAEAIKWLTPKDSHLLIIEAEKNGEDPAEKIENAMAVARGALHARTVAEYKRSLRQKIGEQLDPNDYYNVATFIGLIEEA